MRGFIVFASALCASYVSAQQGAVCFDDLDCLLAVSATCFKTSKDVPLNVTNRAARMQSVPEHKLGQSPGAFGQVIICHSSARGRLTFTLGTVQAVLLLEEQVRVLLLPRAKATMLLRRTLSARSLKVLLGRRPRARLPLPPLQQRRRVRHPLLLLRQRRPRKQRAQPLEPDRPRPFLLPPPPLLRLRLQLQLQPRPLIPSARCSEH